MKATPGPWTVDFENTGCEIFAADGKWLFTMDRPLDEFKANALLVAAAPDLLEALKEAEVEIASHFAVPPLLLASIRAALSKAEGK